MGIAASMEGQGARELGRAWLALSIALLMHVIDEALTGFLSVYNPTVEALREARPWLPLPTFGFGEWLAGLLITICVLLLLGRFLARGSRSMRGVAYVFAVLMIINGMLHVAATLAGRTVASVQIMRPMPGFYSSPVLLAASVYLLFRLRKSKERHEAGGRGDWAYAAAAVTVLIGAGSLLVFGWFLWRGRGVEWMPMGMDWQRAMAWDALLCFAFFLQHSGMVRKSFQGWLGRFLPVRWHRIVYTLASGVVLLLLVLCWQPSHIVIGATDGPWRWGVRAALLSAVAIFVWGIRSLENFDAFGTQALLARGGEPAPASLLSVRGPYRWVRHPFYTACIIALWASPTLTLDRLLLNALWTGWIVLGAKLEERDLVAEFGEPYRRYQRAVPMLIPWRVPSAP